MVTEINVDNLWMLMSSTSLQPTCLKTIDYSMQISILIQILNTISKKIFQLKWTAVDKADEYRVLVFEADHLAPGKLGYSENAKKRTSLFQISTGIIKVIFVCFYAHSQNFYSRISLLELNTHHW